MPQSLVHITTVDISLRYLLLNQLKYLKQSGFEVATISASGPDVATVEENGFPHFAVEMKRSITPLSDLVAVWKLIRLLKKHRFQIVHTHTPKATLLGQLAAKVVGTPIVVNTLHGFYFHDETPYLARRFFILWEKIAARFADVILSQNYEDIKTAVAEKICPPSQIKFLGNGIDIERFNPQNIATVDQQRLRQELNLTENMIVAGFVGRLVREKGLIELLEATKIAREQIPQLRLLIIGPVDEAKEDAFRPEHAAEYEVADICIFTGRREDMPQLFSLMDIFVLPSHREGFPRSPMEASAMSVPSIVTDIRGCREAVKDRQNGLLVPLKNPVKLAEAMIRLIKDDKLRHQLAQNCRPMAEENFDEIKVFQKVKEEYEHQAQRLGL